MKKLIALVLTVAMLVTCFAFSASAETTVASLELQGPTAATVNDVITVKVRLNDSTKTVGGVQGTIVAEGAELVENGVTVNPELETYNNTEDVTTIYTTDGNNIKFAAVNKLDGESYETRVWFIIQYKVTKETATFSLEDVKVANKNADNITNSIDTTSTLKVNVVNPDKDTVITIKNIGILKETNVEKQATVVDANISVKGDKKVTELGVIFYPTALLDGAELKIDTSGAIIAATEEVDNYISAANGGFKAVMAYGFSDKENALKFLGTRVSARVYYKDADGVHYATNTVDSYIQNGVANKAALNTVLDYGATVEKPVVGEGCVTKDEFNNAKDKLNTSVDDWDVNRELVLKYAVDNAPIEE